MSVILASQQVSCARNLTVRFKAAILLLVVMQVAVFISVIYSTHASYRIMSTSLRPLDEGIERDHVERSVYELVTLVDEAVVLVDWDLRRCRGSDQTRDPMYPASLSHSRSLGLRLPGPWSSHSLSTTESGDIRCWPYTK